MESKSKLSEHYIRLGMSLDMKAKIELWRGKQAAELGKVPSFSEACRQLIEKGLSEDD